MPFSTMHVALSAYKRTVPHTWRHFTKAMGSLDPGIQSPQENQRLHPKCDQSKRAFITNIF